MMQITSGSDTAIGHSYHNTKRCFVIVVDSPEINSFIERCVEKLYTNGYIEDYRLEDVCIYRELIESLFSYIIYETMTIVEQTLNTDTLQEIFEHIINYGNFIETVESFLVSFDRDTYSYLETVIVELSAMGEMYTIFKDIMADVFNQLQIHLQNVNFSDLYIATKFSLPCNQFIGYIFVEYSG